MWIEPSEEKRRAQVLRRYLKESERERKARDAAKHHPLNRDDWFSIVWGAVYMVLWLSLWFL